MRDQDADLALFLLTLGADPNKWGMQASWGSPLLNAAFYKHLRLVSELLKRDAVVDAKNEHGWTPLFFVCTNDPKNHVEAIKLLVEAGADPNVKDNDGEGILDMIEEDNRKIVLPLLEKKNQPRDPEPGPAK